MAEEEFYFYEALWLSDHDGLIQDDFEEHFKTYEELMAFYEQHKYDKDKYGWHLTKRTYEFEILENYLHEQFDDSIN